MSDWRHQGKQVLQDGRHFADAAGELEAMMIVNAMRALDVSALPRRLERRTIYHHVRREQDEMVCSCGARWDVADAAPYAH